MRRLAAFLLLLAPLAGAPTAVADDGFDLGSARRVRVTGTIFDAKTNRPLAEGQVTVEGPYGDRRAATGPDGDFALTTDAYDGLGNVSIVFSHADYQQKYLETVLRDAFRGDVEVKVAAGRAHVKARKLDVDVACGDHADVATKTAETAPVRVVCDGPLTGVEISVRGNRIAVLAAGPFTLVVANGRMRVRDSQNETIEMRVAAAMLPR
jgi:hypothetical protein